MSEHDEQATLFQFLSYHPNLSVIFATPNGFYSTPAQKSKMKQEGLKSGVWDIFVPIPSKGYHGMFLEMKYGKNKLTDSQKSFGEAVSRRGYKCEVAYSGVEAYKIIIEYLGVKPKITCI
jgi:hypothetical protein